MRPIRLYFAGSWSGSCSIEEVDLGIRNKLVSFAYPEQLKTWLKVSSGVKGSVIIDSGAFSAWTKGKAVDIDSYIEYAHQAIEDCRKHGKEVHVVNLDVIPGKFGDSISLNKVRKKENLELIEKAAREGFENMKIMISNGIKPIHVFHQGEDWRWLDKMLEYVDYIGISPANDMPVDSRKKWMEGVFRYLYKKGGVVDAHGFAVWVPSVLRDLPWTSCDAASWRLLAAYGKCLVPVGGFKDPDYSKPPLCVSISTRRGVAGFGDLTPKKLELIETCGYTYSELSTSWRARAKVNIKYFLGLERWLNEYKEKVDYCPKKGFGFC